MKLPQKIFNQLCDTLAIIAICANGRKPDGEEEISAVEEYARQNALNILDIWANALDEEWEIISND